MYQTQWQDDAAKEIMRRVNQKQKFEQAKCTLTQGIQHDCRNEAWQNLFNNYLTPLGFLGLVVMIFGTAFKAIKKQKSN